jgi:thiamine biosynthesis lipoprotein
MPEAHATFPCLGAECAIRVGGDGPLGSAEEVVAAAREQLLAWHDRFTRFEPTSELSRFNADPRTTVPVSPEMARFATAVRTAGELSGGLVDATLLGSLEDAGYAGDLRTSTPLATALRLAPPRRPARPHPAARWRRVSTSPTTVTRPPGVRLDSGGLVKGVLADLLGEALSGHDSFAVDCAGDLRIGGIRRRPRPVRVESPLGTGILHTFDVGEGGIATSGIGRRSWRGRDGGPAHHLLDPATGLSAFTGVVQVTALAPTALEAEIRAKTALLAGPDAAAGWLPHGGLVVFDDASFRLFPGSSKVPVHNGSRGPQRISLPRARRR